MANLCTCWHQAPTRSYFEFRYVSRFHARPVCSIPQGRPLPSFAASALHRYEIKVSFLTDYYWGLPLCRGFVPSRLTLFMFTGRRSTFRDEVTDGIALSDRLLPLSASCNRRDFVQKPRAYATR